MKFQELRLLPLLTAFILLFVYPSSISAHPGNTAADGCHYCRTNCDRWGVPWNVRHCHGGSIIAPVATIKPTIRPTIKPTIAPTPKPTETPIITPTPSPSPEVKGLTTEDGPTPSPTPTPTIEPLTAGQTATSLGVLALMVAFPVWVISKIIKKFRKPKLEA